MKKKQVYLGNNKIGQSKKEVKGCFVEMAQEKFYKISNFHEMPDFFMTIVSNSDHWMYLSSNGSLTAGRVDRDNSLFPYYSVDKIHDYKSKTGSKTFILIEDGEKSILWKPFSQDSDKHYNISRNLYKSVYGNKIIFEEELIEYKVRFRYCWCNSEKFGWIKKAELYNDGDQALKIDMLDGLMNILPYGVNYAFQNELSNLLDAYKKNELVAESKLGLFMLSSIPVDRAEPSEALKTTTVWSYMHETETKVLISDHQLGNYVHGKDVFTEEDIRASKGAYYINFKLKLEAKESSKWYFAAEINQDAADVADLDIFLRNTEDPSIELEMDVKEGSEDLVKLVASSDGLQIGQEEMSPSRHFTNTLYNVMRGGIFNFNHLVEIEDLKTYFEQSNREKAGKFIDKLKTLPEKIQYTDLAKWAIGQNDRDLERICAEYLPLTFSRRHGDPSRPWNKFSIELKDEEGKQKLNYQGNWRDIFQNWEALGLSFPEFLDGMISKFLNASTADGYNPYRVTREGIDWESPDPHDPWAYIGYWGDHQIIYLQKFLEHSDAYYPGKLNELLNREIFVYANVPYRIKAFDQIVEDPKNTIEFDHDLNDELNRNFDMLGADGKLLRHKSGELVRANLSEKILVTLLSKLSNFIPEAGIWLNTQRPEWNDANNALVGNGVSMVTLNYIRRFIKFWEEKFRKLPQNRLEISREIYSFFEKIFKVFEDFKGSASKGFTDEERYDMARLLGIAGSEYREALYVSSFSGERTSLSTEVLVDFCETVLKFIDETIKKNKRADGLYHAYNLVSITSGKIAIRNLYEMLEGQVAVLSSGLLSINESLKVMDALKDSRVFREDQFSYMLYPNRELPRFREKNNIPKKKLESSLLLQKLLADHDKTIIKKDLSGICHFKGSFRNAEVLENALNSLDPAKYGELVEKEISLVLDIYEHIFDHQSFTGRSGTFYGYEGLGSIYWHMVSKLLLAVQECYFKGVSEGVDQKILNRIKDHYYEIKAGIGLYKSPEIYGAFPMDAYSHTPGGAGVKQPGLTGQVKEDVISRFSELGVKVDAGKICFDISLMHKDELLKEEKEFRYFDLFEAEHKIYLEKYQLAFTFCQVPFIYSLSGNEQIVVYYRDGRKEHFNGNKLSENISSMVFSRSGEVSRIDYNINH